VRPRSIAVAALWLVPWLALGAPPPPSAIELTADPLSDKAPDAGVTLHIKSSEPPVIEASVGEVRPARQVSDGRFEAVYLPPSEAYPQVAIIVARTPRSSGWLPLPLPGTGELAVTPDASGSATVVVGNRRFGPQRAGPDGKAVIRIVVPPGTKYAVSGGKRLNLNLPEVPHVFLTPDQTEVPAHLAASVELRIFVVTPDGKPRRGAPLRLSVDSGTVSGAREVEPGVYDATWKVAPSVAASVSARLDDEGVAFSTSLKRPSSEPQALRIDVDRETATAGESPFDFAVVVEDGTGNPVDSTGPRATISSGAFLGWTKRSTGVWVGHVSIPERLDSTTLVIAATDGELAARREVKLVPGPVAELLIDGEPPSGKGPEPLTVTTVDRFGNPTGATPPEATSSTGSVRGPTSTAAGTYRFDYQPPLAATATHDEIVVQAGNAKRTISIELKRDTGLPYVELGPKAGLAFRSGATSVVLGAEGLLWPLGSAAPFGLELEGSWYSFSKNRTLAAQPEPLAFSSTATYLSLTAGPAWRLRLGSRTIFTASVGGGAVHAQSKSKLGTQPTLNEATWVAAGTAAVSLAVQAWGGYPYLELRAAYVSDPRLETLSGSFVPVFVQLGYRFKVH
jgi:hypothetical protein